jgi:hypothetical protein
MGFVFGILLWMAAGFVYSSALEWFVHKHLLHGLGKKKNSFWSFHWSGHHKASRKNNFKDPRWEKIPLHKDKEFLGVVLITLLHIPTIWLSPLFYSVLAWRAIVYYRTHKKSHEDEEWAKQNVPWHWDHHMGPRKAVEANWCVTNPFFDNLMGTRVKYYLTTEYFLNQLKRNNKDEYKRIKQKLEKVPERTGAIGGIRDHVHAEDQSSRNESRH